MWEEYVRWGVVSPTPQANPPATVATIASPPLDAEARPPVDAPLMDLGTVDPFSTLSYLDHRLLQDVLESGDTMFPDLTLEEEEAAVDQSSALETPPPPTTSQMKQQEDSQDEARRLLLAEVAPQAVPPLNPEAPSFSPTSLARESLCVPLADIQPSLAPSEASEDANVKLPTAPLRQRSGKLVYTQR